MGTQLQDHPAIARCMATGYPYAIPEVEYKTCCVCGENIYIGLDAYYNFEGNIVCEECERDYTREHYRRCG